MRFDEMPEFAWRLLRENPWMSIEDVVGYVGEMFELSRGEEKVIEDYLIDIVFGKED